MRVSRDQIRALRLRAHNLVEPLRGGAALPAAAGVCGVQNTPPGSGELALAARVDGLTRPAFDRAVAKDKSLVQVWSLRGSPYYVPSVDLPVFTRAILPDDEESWRVAVSGFRTVLDSNGLTAVDVVRRVARATCAVLDRRTLTKRQLGEALAPHMPPALRPWFAADTFSEFTAVLVRAVSATGSICIAPRRGKEASFVRTDQWLPGPVPALGLAAARRELVRRFLRSQGPSTVDEYASWAGISVGLARRSWATIQHDLVGVTVDGQHRAMLPEDRAELGGAEPPRGLRLLPPHDPYLMAPDRDTLVEGRDRQKYLWRATGNPGAILFHGDIVGGWRARKAGRTLRLVLEPFGDLPVAARRAVEPAAATAARLRECVDVTVDIAEPEGSFHG